MKIKIKENSGRYDMKGNFEFLNENNKIINIKAIDALEIAYALFDWAGMPYTLLDEINEMIEDDNVDDYIDEDDKKFWEEVDLKYQEYRDEQLLKK